MSQCEKCQTILEPLGTTPKEAVVYTCLNEDCSIYSLLQYHKENKLSRMSELKFVKRQNHESCIVTNPETGYKFEMFFKPLFSEITIPQTDFDVAIQENYLNYIKENINQALDNNNEEAFVKWTTLLNEQPSPCLA